ncbi:MAG: hypothetical protein OJF51_003322 [Nitrospira sp.]|jgi:hypothetical protein|nr:MAG: hypothetical protein OJF51_003322 [Nitrospira sp.]
MGLAIDSSDEAMLPSHEQNATRSIPHPPIKPTIGKEQAVFPPRNEPAAPIRTKPLEILQAFQDSLQSAKDLNGLLGTFVQSLQRDAGFDRVGLALLNQNDSDLLVGRLVLGVNPQHPTSVPYQAHSAGNISFSSRFSSESIQSIFLTFQTRWAGL